MFDKFIAERKLGDFTGRGIVAKIPGDPKYNQSRMRHLPFDRCFDELNNRVEERE